MHQYVANRNVFRDCLKLFPPIIGLRKLSGKEFQTDGPATVRMYGGWSVGLEFAGQFAVWNTPANLQPDDDIQGSVN